MHLQNPYYIPATETLWPVVTDRSIVFWSEYFFRYDFRLNNHSTLAINHRIPMVTFPPHSLNQKLAALQHKLTKLKLVVPPSGARDSTSSKLFDEIFEDLENLKLPLTDDGYSSGEGDSSSLTVDTFESTLGFGRLPSGFATIRMKSRASLKNSRPTWMHDDHSKQCCHCRTKIGKGTRHHCRNCGLVR